MGRVHAIVTRCVAAARLSPDVSGIKLVFRIPPERPTPNFPSSWNVTPTDSLSVVGYECR